MDKGHTKTPWGMRAAWGGDEEAEIYPAWDRPEVGDSAEICLVKEWGVHTAEDNAAFIVRAVNQHESLLKCAEALRVAKDYVADALHEQSAKADSRSAYPQMHAKELTRAAAIEADLNQIELALHSLAAVNTPKDINHV